MPEIVMLRRTRNKAKNQGNRYHCVRYCKKIQNVALFWLAIFALQRILISQRSALSPSFGAFPPYDFCRALGRGFFLVAPGEDCSGDFHHIFLHGLEVRLQCDFVFIQV